MDKYSTTRFNKAPTISHSRTRFDLSHDILTTGNTGEFIPILCEPIYAGETISLKSATLTRLETSLHQTMDNAYVELAFFYVDAADVWADFDKFLGANPNPWTQSNTYTIPQMLLRAQPGVGVTGKDVEPGSLLNHLYLPAGNYYQFSGSDYSVDLLPLRCVFKIWNDWYRDENYDTEIGFSTASQTVNLDYFPTLNGVQFDCCKANQMLRVNRFHDIFSSVLPAPQKGVEVKLPLGTTAPVSITNIDTFNSPGALSNIQIEQALTPGSTSQDFAIETNSVYAKAKLEADLSQATAATINQLRLAIAAQSIAERDARGGTRLKEKILSTFGVNAPDIELGRSEFLGGKRFPVSMMEVLQTSETGTTVLGSNAGVSKTIDVNGCDFTRSFDHYYGYVLGFIYVRTARSYSQGINRKFLVKNKFDLYDPMLDNIGEVDVKGVEMKAIEHTASDISYLNSPIGYQEPWYWLKEGLNRFSGFFQPGVNGSLSSWHYGDDYSNVPGQAANNPVVDADWLKEGPENVDRTIAVSSNAAFQWSFNIHFDLQITRQMSLYNIPNTFGFGSK